MKVLNACFWVDTSVKDLNYRHRREAFQARMVIAECFCKPECGQVFSFGDSVINRTSRTTKEKKARIFSFLIGEVPEKHGIKAGLPVTSKNLHRNLRGQPDCRNYEHKRNENNYRPRHHFIEVMISTNF